MARRPEPSSHFYMTFGDGTAEPITREAILLIDPDGEHLAAALTDAGYQITSTCTGEEGQAALDLTCPELIVLELVLPDTDGLLLISALRLLTRVPIVVCSLRNRQIDRVLSLRLGADDFVSKPFDSDEIEARIAAVLRRSKPRPQPERPSGELTLDDLILSPLLGKVTIGGERVDLTPIEFRVLKTLMTSPNEAVTRKTIAQTVWGCTDDMDLKPTIAVHIGRLRGKVDGLLTSPLIESVRGVGYLIEHAQAASLVAQPSAN